MLSRRRRGDGKWGNRTLSAARCPRNDRKCPAMFVCDRSEYPRTFSVPRRHGIRRRGPCPSAPVLLGGGHGCCPRAVRRRPAAGDGGGGHDRLGDRRAPGAPARAVLGLHLVSGDRRRRLWAHPAPPPHRRPQRPGVLPALPGAAPGRHGADAAQRPRARACWSRGRPPRSPPAGSTRSGPGCTTAPSVSPWSSCGACCRTRSCCRWRTRNRSSPPSPPGRSTPSSPAAGCGRAPSRPARGWPGPNGFAVAAAVLAVAAYEIVRRRGKVSHRLWTGAALAPLGWLAYFLWVGRRQGDLLGGYFEVQRLWGSRFDFGLGALRFVRHLLLQGDRLVFPMSMVIVAARPAAVRAADRGPRAAAAAGLRGRCCCWSRSAAPASSSASRGSCCRRSRCCCRWRARWYGRREPGRGTRLWWSAPWPGSRSRTGRICVVLAHKPL